jgi:hypothetical protein
LSQNANFFADYFGENILSIIYTRDRCYDFKNIFAQKLGKILAFSFQTITSFFTKNMIITLVFEKTANFLQKIGKIA